jgi:hypothetical protein
LRFKGLKLDQRRKVKVIRNFDALLYAIGWHLSREKLQESANIEAVTPSGEE